MAGRRTKLLVAVTAVTAALVPVAIAGQASVFIEGSKQVKKGYSDLTSLKIGTGKSKVGYVKAKNTNNGKRTGFLSAELFGEDEAESQYKIRYYKGKKPKKSKDITDKVVLRDVRGVKEDEGYRFSLKAKKSKTFSVKIKKRVPTDFGLCVRTDLNAGMEFDVTFFEVNDIGCLNR
jgi:hypothetical protein